MEALIVLAVVYFEPTYCARGVLHRESFFQGRPTSYWAAELEQWEVGRIEIFLGGVEPNTSFISPFYQRQSTWFEQQLIRWRLRDVRPFVMYDRPEIMCGDAEATAVLRELLHHSSPKVVRLAQIGLGIDPEFPAANLRP
jgi:hypothetical protein